jgi:DNA-binding MarR family transcriptional regulator
MTAIRHSGTGSEAADSVDRILAGWEAQRPDLDFSPVGVVTRIARLRSHLDAGVEALLLEYGLSGPDFRVLVALRRVGPPFALTQARLMGELALTSGTVSVRVDRLVERGVVLREPSTHDRRAQVVRLTDEGLRLFDELGPRHLANEDRLLSALSREERALLAGLLRRLLVSFENGGVDAGLWLGMRLEPAHVARARRTAVGLSDTAGLLVADVLAGTPGADAGIARGDLIVAVDGRELRSHADLAEALRVARARGCLQLTVLRGEEPAEVGVRVPRTD